MPSILLTDIQWDTLRLGNTSRDGHGNTAVVVDWLYEGKPYPCMLVHVNQHVEGSEAMAQAVLEAYRRKHTQPKDGGSHG